MLHVAVTDWRLALGDGGPQAGFSVPRSVSVSRGFSIFLTKKIGPAEDPAPAPPPPPPPPNSQGSARSPFGFGFGFGVHWTPGSKASRTPPWTRTLGSKANRAPPWTRALGPAPGRALVWTRAPGLLGLGVLRAGRVPPLPSRPSAWERATSPTGQRSKGLKKGPFPMALLSSRDTPKEVRKRRYGCLHVHPRTA
jgi:hypothetical protein